VQRVGRSLVYDGRQTLAELSRNTVCDVLLMRALCGAVLTRSSRACRLRMSRRALALRELTPVLRACLTYLHHATGGAALADAAELCCVVAGAAARGALCRCTARRWHATLTSPVCVQGSRGPPAQVYEALLDRILQRLRHPRCEAQAAFQCGLALTALADFCSTRVICLVRKPRRCWRVRKTRAPGVAAGR
jgi:hypothetical protein